MTVQDWLGKDNQLGIDIWEKKYKYEDETFDEGLERISGGDQELKQLIIDKKFLPAGRILANRGLNKTGRKITLSNCYVATPPEDNLESIFQCASNMARTYSYGGGVGVDISKLAPRGAKINNTAKSTSGAVSFMELYALTTSLIGQNGRRGALMISLDCSHPDIEEFIAIKTDLTKINKANISIRITDEFMNAVKNDEIFNLSYTRETSGEKIVIPIKAKALFRKMAEANWDFAEPAALFWDRIKNWTLLSETDGFEFAGVNPCFTGDMKLLTDKGYKTFEELDGKIIKIQSAFRGISVGKVWCSGEKETIKLYLSNGDSIQCTPDHVFMIDGGRTMVAKATLGQALCQFEPSQKPLLVNRIEPCGTQKVYDFEEPSAHWGVVNGVVVHNCAEESLPAGGSCLLGSLNLSAFVENEFTDSPTFNYDEFEKSVKICVKGLNDILDEGLPLHPLREQIDSVRDWRQIGLGIMGLSDLLIKLGLKYGSEESVKFCEIVAQSLLETAFIQSSNLASEQGSFPKYKYENIISTDFFKNNLDKTIGKVHLKQNGLRNSQILTIPPCGTIATMLGISSGIEPIFANSYTRKTESLHGKDVSYKVYTPIVEQYMRKFNIDDESKLPEYFVSSKDIDFHNRIDMQSIWQKYIDASISSTVNVPKEFTVEQVEELYLYAWEKGLKGITIFRDGCKRLGILTTDNKTEKPKEPQKEELVRGFILDISNDVVGKKRKLMTGCGSLHCVAFFDPQTGDLLETYLSKGSTGGCQNFMVGLSRMISLSARAGCDINSIVNQLDSCGVCPSYSVRSATKHDTSKGSCCPMAIGNALIEMHNEMLDEIGVAEREEDYNLHDSLMAGLNEAIEIETAGKDMCPDCNEPLIFEGGCNTCKNCGWSKCT